jgi:NAD(P)-dependent dehydrogenase (short-subunit alcohol dehydrogenase family)
MLGAMAKTQDLSGRVALVTGAARGIGEETARRLASRGMRLVLTDLDEEPLRELVAAIGESQALGVVADVCDLGAMEGAVARGVERFGGLDVVVANAGIAAYGSVLEMDPAAFRRLMDVNVDGVFHTARAALPALVERQGYVLVLSSLAAFTPAPGMAAYNASKAGVEHFANALRVEVAHLGIDVGTAHPSWIDTPLLRDVRADLGTFTELTGSLPGPLSRTTDVATCVTALVDGIEHRRRRVYVPGWVGVMAKARMVLTAPLGDAVTRRLAASILARMDAEMHRLGRSTSARNQAHLHDAPRETTPA